MRNSCLVLLFSLFLFSTDAFGQSDSAVEGNSVYHRSREDSAYMARLNTGGTLMIAGGIGVCAAGSYLMYQGFKVYNSEVPGNIPEDVNRNHKQGTAYIVAGGIGILGGIVLTAFGAKNKHEFAMRKKMLSLESGLLQNGNIGLVMNF